MKDLRFLILATSLLVFVALPSCSSDTAGLTGGFHYIDPDTGAKAGLEYGNGEGRAYVRKNFVDPETGEVIAQADFEKRFGETPEVNPEK